MQFFMPVGFLLSLHGQFYWKILNSCKGLLSLPVNGTRFKWSNPWEQRLPQNTGNAGSLFRYLLYQLYRGLLETWMELLLEKEEDVSIHTVAVDIRQPTCDLRLSWAWPGGESESNREWERFVLRSDECWLMVLQGRFKKKKKNQPQNIAFCRLDLGRYTQYCARIFLGGRLTFDVVSVLGLSPAPN